MTYTFSEDIFSDFHKDAYGYRPTADHPFYSASDDEKQLIWDRTSDAMKEEMEREEQQLKADLKAFQTRVQDTIDLGAGDFKTAIRWMCQKEEFREIQCVEHWVWKQGILFSDYGREVVKHITEYVVDNYVVDNSF
jgi:hypothetical protein